MNYRIDTDEQRKLILVKYSGMITLQDRIQAVKDGTEILNRTGYHNVVVDFSDATVVFQNAQEASDFAMAICDSEVLKHCRTAFVDKPGQQNNDFVEMLAAARHYNFRHFTDINDAYRWLA